MNIKLLAKVAKGFANEQRIKILNLLCSDGTYSLADIAETIDLSYKSTAQHLQRMTNAGLITKTRQGKSVVHELTDLGARVQRFLSRLL